MENKVEYKKFGILFAAIIFALTIYRITNYGLTKTASAGIIISLVLTIVSIMRPHFLKVPYKFWIKVGAILGHINSKIILSIIFYFVVTPIGVVARIFGVKYLSKVPVKDQLTYKIYRNQNSQINLEESF
jgi:hypothetical protein